MNGLEFWSQDEIELRNKFVEDMVDLIKDKLSPIRVMQIEAPILTPDSKIYEGYDKKKMFSTSDELTLRPQTTMGSYSIAEELLKKGDKPPFVIWQHGKSFRREQKKTRKHMRLKEFYQLEFQIIYDADRPHYKINAKKLIKEIKMKYKTTLVGAEWLMLSLLITLSGPKISREAKTLWRSPQYQRETTLKDLVTGLI